MELILEMTSILRVKRYYKCYMDLGVVPPLMRIGSILKNVHEWKVHMAINGAKRDIEVSSEHRKGVCVITDLLS